MMKFIKRTTALLLATTLIFSFVYMPTAMAKNVFKWTNIKEIQITAYSLNVRTGPSTDFPVIARVSQNQVVDVVGTLGSWFVVHLDSNAIGCVSSTWTRVYSYYDDSNSNSDPEPSPSTPDTTENTSGLTTQEKEMFDLINAERTKNGLAALKIDMEVVKVARVKAQDMADNKYFSHTSPTYGSPFDMLKQFGINYTTAGENIAGNQSVQNAHNALMNSSGHRANILSSKYDAIGIGIVKDTRYGYVFVQMFVKR